MAPVEHLRELLARLPPTEVFATMSPAEQDAFFEKLTPPHREDGRTMPPLQPPASRNSHTEELAAASAVCFILVGAYLITQSYMPGELGTWIARVQLFGAVCCLAYLVARVFKT